MLIQKSNLDTFFLDRVLQEIVLFNPESENRSSSQELPVSAGLKILQARVLT